jgi:CheY-like chemotaxis protein
MDGAVGRMTPAIAITAQATGDQAVRSARAGFQMHITKPFDPAVVIRGIASALERV